MKNVPFFSYINKYFLFLAVLYLWISFFILPWGYHEFSEKIRLLSSYSFIGLLLLFLMSGSKISKLSKLILLAGTTMSGVLYAFTLDASVTLKAFRTFVSLFFVAVILDNYEENYFDHRHFRIFFNILAYVTSIILLGQLVHYRFGGELFVFNFLVSGQATLFATDPNYTGFVILTFMLCLFFLNRLELFALFFVASFFIASRNLFLSLIVFVLMVMIGLAFHLLPAKRKLGIQKWTAGKLCIAAVICVNLLTIALSYTFPLLKSILSQYQNSFISNLFMSQYTGFFQHRFFSTFDNSNHVRFLLNREFFEAIYKDPLSIIRGINGYPENYTGMAHNSFFESISVFGLVYWILFFYFLYKIVRHYHFSRSVVLTLGTIFLFGCFLPGIFQSKTWILACIIPYFFKNKLLLAASKLENFSYVAKNFFPEKYFNFAKSKISLKAKF